ncbi:MAG: hybrid sensor histidine kinase/response regulator [Pseudomonadales bacterium]|nr:hybrid sensor histidine kinase/response regulator [Pseudomonadales bacterium]
MSPSDNFGDDSLSEMFVEEADTQLEALAEHLVALEDSDQPQEILNVLMRAAHSLKGAARIVDATAISQLAHAVEDIFVAAQKAELALNATDIDTLLAAADLMRKFVPPNSADAAALAQMLTRLKETRENRPPATKPSNDAQDSPTSAPAAENRSEPLESDIADLSLLEMFTEEAESQLAVLSEGLIELESGAPSESLLEAMMRAAHSIKGAARIVDLTPIVEVAHALEDTFVSAQKGDLHFIEADYDRLLAAVDWLSKVAQNKPQSAEPMASLDTVVAQLAQIGHANNNSSDRTQTSTITEPSVTARVQPPAPHTTVPSENTDESQGQPTVAGSTHEKKSNQNKSIRMSAEAMERLTGMTSEAVVESARMELIIDELSDLGIKQKSLNKTLTRLRRRLEAEGGQGNTLRDLDEALGQLSNCMSLLQQRDEKLDAYARRNSSLSNRLSREAVASRMLHFSTILKGYPRLIRDLNKSLEKRGKLIISGEQTLIDREILEKLDSALNHLVRNAMDHGLDTVIERQTANKEGPATLKLEAFHQSGRLRVLVQDNGRGIDPNALRKSIISKELIEAAHAEQLSPDELYEFMFLPGFSTAKALTDVSGRGVGLDAVRTMVQEAGGRISVQSKLGEGTSFDIELPVTRSVARVLMISIAGESYAIPIARIEFTRAINPDQIRTVEGHNYFQDDGRNVALVSATKVLELPDSLETKALELRPVIVIQETGRFYALEIDDFIGERDLMVRPLDPRLSDIPDVAAVSTDENGSVVLILDVDDLVRNMEALISGGRQLGRARDQVSIKSDRKRLLVVDDSLTVRQAERQLLENAGYDVEVAVDGLEAWSAVRLSNYDLIVSDVDMPRMNGIELVKKIRSESQRPDIPIIIVSYKDRDDDRLRGMEAGANYYLAKGGFEDSVLLNAVEDLIGAAH